MRERANMRRSWRTWMRERKIQKKWLTEREKENEERKSDEEWRKRGRERERERMRRENENEYSEKEWERDLGGFCVLRVLLLNGLDKEPPQQVFFFLTKNAFVRLKRTGKWNFSILFISLVDVKTWLKCWRVFSSIVAGQSQVFCGLGMNWEKCLPYINVDLTST